MDKLKELKSSASQACIEIFKLFDEVAIQSQLPPIRNAWHLGRELSATDVLTPQDNHFYLMELINKDKVIIEIHSVDEFGRASYSSKTGGLGGRFGKNHYYKLSEIPKNKI